MACIKKTNKQIRKRERVPVPEFGPEAYVVVEELGANDLHELRQRHTAAPDSATFLDFERDILSRSLVDDDGVKLFADSDDVKAADWSLPVIRRLCDECLRVSGIIEIKN